MPPDDDFCPKSEDTGSMAAKTPVSKSTLNPNAPLFFPAAFSRIEDFSPEWWNLVHSSPSFRDYWISERMQYVDGEELSAEDVDHLETMVDFIDEEEPKMTVDDCSGFLEELEDSTQSDYSVPLNSAIGQENLQEQELVRSVKQLDIQAHIPQPLQKEHNFYHDKIALSPSKIASFTKRSAMHRIQQPR